MTISSSKFVTHCHFRMQDFFCDHGGLYRADDGILVTIEGEPVLCQVCDGTGLILTELGKSVVEFLETSGRPILRRIIREVLEEKKSS